MKKWILFLSLGVLFAGAYFIFSAKSPTSQTITVHASVPAANRYFLDTGKWARWWPKPVDYRVAGVFYNEVRLLLRDKDQREFPVSLRIGQLSQDSVLFGWEGKLPREGREEMETVLQAFRSFAQDGKNIYGVDFQRTLSKDSTLITITRVEPAYPSTDEIYRRVDSLKEYALANGARVINYPMMNVTQQDGGQYKVMIALSLDKTLAGNDRIIIKRFVPWKMIEGEVQGGTRQVQRAMKELYRFRDDYRLSIMALPFESLVTDRRQEPDSTKWVTKVCAPIS